MDNFMILLSYLK